MKYFNICLLFIICALCYGLVAAQEEGGSVSPAKRIAALRRPVGKAAKPTTTTTAAPAQNDAGDGEEYDEEAGLGDHGEEGDEAAAADSSTTTTSTEAPKKVGPVIRPFRSNDDFLNSLKRRQQNAKKHRAEKVPASKPAKKSDESASGEQEDQAPAAAPAPGLDPIQGFKGNSALSRRKLAKPVKATPEQAADDDAAAEESEQQQKEEAKPKRPIGRLALRKRN
ncbi:LOW QUALITY PROTEIN: myristoylated alanine-rich C-kinase substrate [Drosophila obscura]|uniref:LOW QUALITY PROTEIN: myristoylated alanine-rich C-kinase substrate n=1 Tax=Drosophila obscura TaxID=7282 RepID=UPI001BB2B107|nr:LOW QUALITY PROTEIN: myristoylated alanine-rich C-kinase substrate [Drosophila obscura]